MRYWFLVIAGVCLLLCTGWLPLFAVGYTNLGFAIAGGCSLIAEAIVYLADVNRRDAALIHEQSKRLAEMEAALTGLRNEQDANDLGLRDEG